MPWHTVQDSAGNSYRCFEQEQKMSCGVASVLMIVNLVTGREMTASYMRNAVGQAEGAFERNRFGVRDYSRHGTGASALSSVLRKYGCTGWFKTPFMANKITNLSPRKPAMLLVWWGKTKFTGKDLGAHWIVTVGVVGNNLVCLDPGFGLYEVPTTSLPLYYKGKITHIMRG